MLPEKSNISSFSKSNNYDKNSFASGEINQGFVPSLSALENNLEKKEQSQEEDNSKTPYLLELFKRRWAFILGATLGVTTGVTWWTFQQSPIYQGKFMLLVEKPMESQTQQNQLGTGLDGGNTNTNIDYSTEVQILGSASVLSPILKEISDRYPDIYEDINLQNLENLDIKQLDKTKLIEVSFRDEDPEKIAFVLDTIASEYLENGLNSGEQNIGEGLKFVRSQIPILEKNINNLQTKIEKLRTDYKFIDPQIQATELTQQLVATEKEFFATQIQIQEAESAYNSIQQHLKLSPEDAIALSYLTESPRYQNLLKQLQEIEIELAKQSAVFTDLSPQIITLKDKQNNILNLIEQEKARYSLRNNNQKNLQEAIAIPSKMRDKLTQDLIAKRDEIKVLNSKKDSLQKVLDNLNQRIASLPAVTREYNNLQRELNTSTESLKRFLETREKLELDNVQNNLNWQIISPPQVGESPVYPIPLYNLLLGLFGGLTFGTVVASIIDKCDRSIYNVKKLKTVTQLPILAEIPFDKNINLTTKKQNIPAFFTSNSPQKESSEKDKLSLSSSLESFRNLYTNISLLTPNLPSKSVVISSSIPREGKSTISLNLAKVATSMGQKVLLIDTDFRLPQLHILVNVDNNLGLTHILTGKIPWQNAIQSPSQWDNLSIITVGEVLSDPSSLLYSQAMSTMMQQIQASQQFDLIIYDSPSLLSFSDGKIIASQTNGLILVVKVGSTKDYELRHVYEQLRVTNTRILGLISNEIR